MIPHGVEVFIGLEPIDLRWGFDRLAGIVADRLTREARSGGLFVFFGKRREALKVLFFDGTGLRLFYKRLDRGTCVYRSRPRARRRSRSRSASSTIYSTVSTSILRFRRGAVRRRTDASIPMLDLDSGIADR